MKKVLLALSFVLVCGLTALMAQTRTITGTVTGSDDGMPIPGASVFVKGTTIGTVTQVNGSYSINVPADAQTLVYSFVGLQSQEQPIAGRSVIDVILVSDAIAVSEVVVIAYGTARKESFTGSAEVVGAEKLQRRTVANVTKALDGMVAGVQTTSGSGQPGSGSSIRIRGFGSINASNDPLYVVDGVPYDGNISAINPNDIASITVLKDASAGALYGARGANGVVMITTKRGETGETRYNLKANWGVSSRAIPRYETLDERGFVESVFQSYKNTQMISNGLGREAAGVAALNAMATGATRVFGANEQYNPFNYPIAQLVDPITGRVRSDAQLRYSQDWLDEVTASNPLRQEYLFSASGSKENTKFMYSLGYLNEEGLLKTTSFERFSGRIAVDTEGKDWFKSGISGNFAMNTSNTSSTTATTSITGNSNIFYSAQLMGPVYPVYELDANGNPVVDPATGKKVFDYGANRPGGASTNFNSVATLFEDRYGTNSDNVSARTYMEFGDTKTGLFEGLKLTLNFGVDYYNANYLTYYNPYFGNAASTNGSINRNNRRVLSYTTNQLLNWNRKFGRHTVDVLGGHEYYSYQYNYLAGTKTGFPFGNVYELDAATTPTSARSYQDLYKIESYLSRFNYEFDDKYYVSLSYRTDGSSRFYKDNRWGRFWSVGGNWRISQEEFMSDLHWLNNLSLKASYGVQGNDDLRYADNTSILYAWDNYYEFGWNNVDMGGVKFNSIENKDLKWEMNENLNVGIEAKVFNRFNATIEWYKRVTEDLLMQYPIASSLGFDSYLRNIGSMRNTGFDISIGGTVVDAQDFKWDLTLNGSTVKNKVLKLADKPEIISGSFIIKEGEALNSFYVARAAGVDPATGMQIYRVFDIDEETGEKDYYYTTNANLANASREIVGSRIPDIYGSINNEFRYKGFDLSVMATYSVGGKVLDQLYRSLLYPTYVGQTVHANRDRAWKEPGDITDIPRFEIGKTYPVTDNDLIDASYFAIKNITAGYTLPSRLSRSVNLETVRFTVSGDNMWLFTHLKGMDPQYNFGGSTTFAYTPTRTVSFGVDIKF